MLRAAALARAASIGSVLAKKASDAACAAGSTWVGNAVLAVSDEGGANGDLGGGAEKADCGVTNVLAQSGVDGRRGGLFRVGAVGVPCVAAVNNC